MNIRHTLMILQPGRLAADLDILTKYFPDFYGKYQIFWQQYFDQIFWQQYFGKCFLDIDILAKGLAIDPDMNRQTFLQPFIINQSSLDLAKYLAKIFW